MTRKNLLIIALLVVAIIAVIIWNQTNSASAPEVQDSNQATNSEQTESSVNTNSESMTNSNESVNETKPPLTKDQFESDLGKYGNNWLLSKVTLNQKGVDMNVNISGPLTLQFNPEKNTYTGFSGCNNFSGTYTTADNYVFDFGAIVNTKKACADPKVQALENSILQAMDNATSTGIKGQQLIFTSEDGYTELVYDQAI